MNPNAYRDRAERGEVQLGTWVTMIRTPAVLTLLRAAGLVALEGNARAYTYVARLDAPAEVAELVAVVVGQKGNQ